MQPQHGAARPPGSKRAGTSLGPFRPPPGTAKVPRPGSAVAADQVRPPLGGKWRLPVERQILLGILGRDGPLVPDAGAFQHGDPDTLVLARPRSRSRRWRADSGRPAERIAVASCVLDCHTHITWALPLSRGSGRSSRPAVAAAVAHSVSAGKPCRRRRSRERPRSGPASGPAAVRCPRRAGPRRSSGPP